MNIKLKIVLLRSLTLNNRNLVRVCLDLISIFLGGILAFIMISGYDNLIHLDRKYMYVYGCFFLVVYFTKKNESKSWSFTNSLDIVNLLAIHAFTSIVTFIYIEGLDVNCSKRILFLTAFFSLALQLTLRFMFRVARNYKLSKKYSMERKKRKNILIYGAGEMGASLAREAKLNKEFPYKILGFIDDDSKKRETYINGVRVISSIDNLENLIESSNIEILVIAMSNIGKEKIKEIVQKCREKKVKIKILPQFQEILLNNKLSNQVRDVKIEDLLGREEIKVNSENIHKLIEKKVIFVTGGAGSIGSELSRQIAKYKPKKLILIDINENDLYFLELELKRLHKEIDLQCEVCNIRESDKLEVLFDEYRPEVIFHAAAHKHVPLMEHNPEEAIKNNIFGTKTLADLSIKYNIKKFVLISTDKAVNPTNIMGATKRACEVVIEEMNKKKKTKFMAVRFGNVLGSNGSVIPIFKNLIKEGKNLTITHPEITRYFMTISEAAQLVIEAGSIGNGGELFILDMGKSIKIVELAKTMISLSNSHVGIDVVGLRPGEKLYEELLYDVTKAIKTSNNKIFVTHIDEMDKKIEVDYYLKELDLAIKRYKKDELKNLMKRFIVTYKEENNG